MENKKLLKTKKFKTSKGITLIALIITIIVLLILAGVSIATLSGDNGVLTKASDSKIVNDIGALKDEIVLKASEAMSDYYEKIYVSNTGESAYNIANLVETIMKKIAKEYVGNDAGGTKEYGTYTVTISGTGAGAKITIQSKAKSSIKTVGTMQDDGKIIWDDIYTSKTPENPPEEDELDSTSETTPWLPDGASPLNNDLATGLTIRDANQNDWVWIEVPKSVTASASLDDPTTIKTALENYVYNTNAKGESSPLLTKTDGSESQKDYNVTTAGFTDVNHDGTGLTNDQYTKKYNAMLKSIKTNGGFYIGKYEVGYKTGDIRQSNVAISNNTPVIQIDAYPYNWVTNAEAESLSETLTNGMASTEDGKAGLMFGIQWDLVLKYLNEKGGLTKADITSNSEDWGNYYYAYNLNQETTHGYKGTLSTSDWETITWEQITSTYSHPNSSDALSTGATERNARLNVYDLAGNMYEWTLEKTPYDSNPCAYRGGGFNNTGSGNPASFRYDRSSSYSSYYYGFRPTLY